jgi:hypothetical protein
MSLLAPVPKIAQSYDENLFIKIGFLLFRICINDFLAKNNYIFATNIRYCLCIPKHTSGELITIL